MPGEGAFGRRFARGVLRHRREVLIFWIVVSVAAVPAVFLSGSYISYSSSTAGVSGSQSQQAQNLLAQVSPEVSQLLVAVTSNGSSPATFCSAVSSFGSAVAAQHLSYYNSTASVCSVFAGLLDAIYGPYAGAIAANRSSFATLSVEVYAFPASFLQNWSSRGYSASSINATYNASGPTSPYTAAFRDWLLANDSGPGGPAVVDRAVAATAPQHIAPSAQVTTLLLVSSVENYSRSVDNATALWLTAHGVILTGGLVAAFTAGGDGGANFVRANGWTLAPAAIRSHFVSPNGQVQLIFVTFTVSDSFRGPDNFYPAQAATPPLRMLQTEYFGGSAALTGPGAISYDTQAASADSGFLFGLTFLFLAVAVFLTLRSWVATLLTVGFVGLATVFGDASILFTGVTVGPVSYVITYVLEAVTLGIVTDYLVFVLYRYREELDRGVDRSTAIETATETAGTAVLTSSVTVAVGLGTLSFVPGLTEWGPVLFLTVLLIGLSEATLLPVLASYLGPRTFLRRRTPKGPAPVERSRFYRGADLAVRRRYLVLVIVAIVAVPAVFFWLTTPASYDVTQGLPSSFPSVQAQNGVENAFGSNLLYPTYVLVHSSASFLDANGSLSSTGRTVLHAVASQILNYSAVTGASGPFVVDRNLTSALLSGATAWVFANGTWAYFLVYITYNPFSEQATHLVGEFRENPGWVVGGTSAATLDQQTQNNVVYPELEILLTVLIGVVLGISFRSLAYPLISLAGVIVSISVTVVLLFWIAQYLLHQVLIYLIPLILFVILLSLGNDYTVFILSRVVEERRKAPPAIAVPRAIGHSGVVVTSLGLILAVSLGSLGLQPLGFLTQLGIAFAISLVLDTFIIRIFYFPAALAFLGRRSDRNPAPSAETAAEGSAAPPSATPSAPAAGDPAIATPQPPPATPPPDPTAPRPEEPPEATVPTPPPPP